jgi:carbon starvation protein CstA
VLAAQLGYMPSILWIVVGCVLAGAVQDFIILALSTRRDGRSLGEMIREELGLIPGLIAQIGTFVIMIIILAVLALIVVKALANSPWGTSTVAATIPDRPLDGPLQPLRPAGKIGEVSVIGFILLMLAIWLGRHIAETPALAALFTWSDGPGLLGADRLRRIASILPVWLLLAPRDYLSTFIKIGAIVLLAIGVVLVRARLRCRP